MNGRTNAKNNGGGKAFAAISVTYPAGSTCTCTDGTKTLKLKNTSGQGFFLIPYAATWTVTATDGTNTKSESVEITTEGQRASVKLIYELVLYENGALYNESLSGGLLLNGETFTIKNPIAISVERTYFGSGSHEWSGSHNLGTANAMSVGEYSNFCINVTKNSGGEATVLMCAASAVLDEVQEANQGIISSLDISALNVLGEFKMPLDGLSVTNVYLGVKVAGAPTARQISLNKIWLE